MHCSCRTVAHTDRVFTVITGNRKRIGEHVINQCAVLIAAIPAAGHFIHPTEAAADIKIIFVLARYLTRFTTGAAGGVNIKT
ncbi:hypothetical protein PROSTU_01657 [Providencia stuartii ATCC 25827]|uniref:Uncharacterized protein n=1 Tax=Providencia stuartii ATCC 25827 TaxID=471874 RepID=A0AA86YXY1_PROST|nr:hypothetical protein PROSTU_01657 [Providencia stuartii ATCC 25827]